MASIIKRTKANGEIVFDCVIKMRHNGILHRESKTFSKEKLAKDYAMRRELELQENSVYKTRAFLSVGDVIQKYIDEFKPDGRSKTFDLNKLMTRDIAKFNVHKLTAKDLIAHIRERNKECQPQTAQNDLIWLNTVIATMRGVIDLDTDLTIFESAREVLRREGLIAKSTQRERRPTPHELWKLSRHFHGSYMLHIMWFAIYSARRQNEIVKLRWEDLNETDRTIWVRDLKDPRKKGVKKKCKLPKSAFKIIQKQPRIGALIFPLNGRTIGANFTRACKLLEIDDLHWHDLRHHATSNLFERGFSIQQVQLVTLHSSWATLQRYCNMNAADLEC
jgi:integrase